MPARVLSAACAVLALAACQTAPGETLIALAEAADPAPLGVAVPVSANPAEGLTENDWGGEVPQARPAVAVNEGGLGDLD